MAYLLKDCCPEINSFKREFSTNARIRLLYCVSLNLLINSLNSLIETIAANSPLDITFFTSCGVVATYVSMVIIITINSCKNQNTKNESNEISGKTFLGRVLNALNIIDKLFIAVILQLSTLPLYNQVAALVILDLIRALAQSYFVVYNSTTLKIQSTITTLTLILIEALVFWIAQEDNATINLNISWIIQILTALVCLACFVLNLNRIFVSMYSTYKDIAGVEPSSKESEEKICKG